MKRFSFCIMALTIFAATGRAPAEDSGKRSVRELKEQAKQFLDSEDFRIQAHRTCILGFTLDANLVTVVSKPTQSLGLRPGDRIVSIDDESFDATSKKPHEYWSLPTGAGVEIRVQRSEQDVDLHLKCLDGQQSVHLTQAILQATVDGRWSKCIQSTWDLEAIDGPSAWLAGSRARCQDADRIESKRRMNQNDAAAVYEYWRRAISESQFSPEALAGIRAGVLSGTSSLMDNNFKEFADELEKVWHDAQGAPPQQDHSSRDRQVPVEPSKSGTCFAVRADGTLVTAFHVISGAKTIRVRFGKGEMTPALLQQSSPSNDVAVLKTSLKTPSFLPLGSIRNVQLGQEVFTIGYPVRELLGEEAKFTEGTVSALPGPEGEANLLQVSIPVQPGNSGGPVVTQRGEAIGVVTATEAIVPFLRSTGTLPQNVNWAISADFLKPLFDLPAGAPASKSREEAIELARRAVCVVEATN